MILKNLLRRKTRTLLTIFGISIGVMAIIVLGAMTDGLQSGYTSMLGGSNADLILSQPDAYDISLSSVDEAVIADIAALPEVAAVSGMLQGWTLTEGEPFFFVFGYPEESFILARFQVIRGDSLDSRTAHQAHGSPLLLGSAAAEVLNKAPGDSMRLAGSVFRVVGIYETGDAFEDSGAVLPLEEAQNLVGKPRQVSLVYIQLKDPSLRERFITRVERRWDDLEVSGADEFAQEQTMVEMMRYFVWIIGGLAILIGGVGMMNAQLMAVFERTREIGVLRAVGWGRVRILWMILGEAVLVSLFGGLLGLGIGWLTLWLISQNLVLLGVVNIEVEPDLLIQAFSVVFILGLVGGLYPAWRASRLTPVEALRYEGGSSGGKARRLPVGGMAVQSLWQRSMRTLLTLSTIGITVGAIMALDGTTRGMEQLFSDAFGDVEIMIRQADVSDTSLSAMDERVGDKIAALPEVQSVSGMVLTALVMPEAGGFFLVLGYEPNQYAIRRMNVVEGERISGNRQVMLGRVVATALKMGPGDTLELGGSRFRVVGIYESAGGWEELGGVLTLRDAQILAGRPHKVSLYFVKLQDLSAAPRLVEDINQQFPEVHAALSGDFVEQMPDFQSMDGMLAGISLMSILVGGVGVLNTMLMSVFERTREIGVLRALGWRRRAILGLILREAVLLGLLGGIAGVGIALGLLELVNLSPLMESIIIPRWEWAVFARALLVSLLLGVIGGLYPAFRATRLQPVEALRYE